MSQVTEHRNQEATCYVGNLDEKVRGGRGHWVHMAVARDVAQLRCACGACAGD